MLLDVHMPACDGFHVLEALRRREQATGGHLPVIALTARAMGSDRERCLQAGMDDLVGGRGALGRRGAGRRPAPPCRHRRGPFLTSGSYAESLVMLGTRDPSWIHSQE